MKIIFSPGFNNSLNDHWQRIWHEQMPGSIWVEHKSWSNPLCNEWVAEFECAIRVAAEEREPVFIIAHSLGVLTVAEWAIKYDSSMVAGAFLVAFPDPQQKDFPAVIQGFESLPMKSLPFSAVTVMSENDPYYTKERAIEISKAWGAEYISAGMLGHINSDSGIGSWGAGKNLLKSFMSTFVDNR